MYENVFNRVEKKYIISKEQYEKLFTMIKNNIEKSEYYQSNIYNIYFDNDNHDLIIKSIEKPIFKQKIRVRSYEIPNNDSNVFFEIKAKYKKTVYKRRVKMKYKDFLNYLETKKYENNQIIKEIDYLIKYYNLKPCYFVAYDRKSFYEKGNKNLRITVDENLRSRTNNLYLDDDKGSSYFKNNECIMEIKSLNSLPLWLTKSLSKCKIYPKSFSKLGSIYTKEQEAQIC